MTIQTTDNRRFVVNRLKLLFIAFHMLIFFGMFTFTGSFSDPHYSADEPEYIAHSIKPNGWHQYRGLFRSAFYPAILAPFTQTMGTDKGFITFKFLIILLSHLLIFSIVSKLSNLFAGSVITTFYQLLFWPYFTAMYIYLGMVVWLSMVLLLIHRPKNAGIAAGVLLLAFFLRMEQLIVCLSFVGIYLALQFFRKGPKQLKRFFMFFTPAILIFSVGVQFYGTSVLEFIPEIVHRKGLSINWEIHDYLHRTNYYQDNYDFKGTRGELTEHLYNQAYLDVFGKTQAELGTITITKLWNLNPTFIENFYKHQIFKRSLPNVVESFTAPRFYENGKFKKTVSYQTRRSTLIPQLFIALCFVLLIGLVYTVRLQKSSRKLEWTAQPTSLEVFSLIIAPLACFIPFLQTQLYPHYFMTVLPVFFLLMAVAFNHLLLLLVKKHL